MPALVASLPAEAREAYLADPRGLILGRGIAERLGARLGQDLTLVVPALDRGMGPAGSRLETVTLRGVLARGSGLVGQLSRYTWAEDKDR